ncbi:sugar ABC transporter ATP-binding protein [Rhodoluna lacicola]|uniref:Ribose/galactose/methyl galactoside import ATP-binding protein n=1 Tax=Rhodoluna lacicola TaxID=529884 RepID=A0A060JF55_9MICO|nr:sugar ABC transporter ATP-binding protein [Rhodoluna lacicola]AIC47157.1 ABC-type sugar transport system, ATPase component [Rhodoluna lacicola]
MSKFIVEMKGITKRFPGVLALNDVKLNLRAGTVHSLMGENGAGKSTLMKILAGVYTLDEGQILIDGEPVSITDPRSGLDHGIAMIHQELSFIPELSAAENIYLGRELRGKGGLVSKARMAEESQKVFDRWGIKINAKSQMKDLSVAQAQMVEIAKAIAFDARIIIMDEPTSAITEREVAALHKIIAQLREAGTAIIYITHKMDEVFAISDEITIFRDGTWVATELAKDMNRDRLISLMVGRELTALFPKSEAKIGEVILEVQNLNRGRQVKDVSFTVKRGEILGFAGLMGSGRTEVLETVFGIYPAESGTIKVRGKEVKIREPHQAISAGIGLLTEDRKKTGIMGVLSVRDNMSVAALSKFTAGGILRKPLIDKQCEEQRQALSLKTPSLNQQIQNLSGGNQQKVLLSRWLLTDPDILIIDEPTRGIDVGAKSEIHRLMSELAKQGKAIIMVSSEMPEILGMSDRVIVMCEGRLVGEVARKDATQEKIMELATQFSDEAVA